MDVFNYRAGKSSRGGRAFMPDALPFVFHLPGINARPTAPRFQVALMPSEKAQKPA